jgi:hypothetical protein
VKQHLRAAYYVLSRGGSETMDMLKTERAQEASSALQLWNVFLEERVRIARTL